MIDFSKTKKIISTLFLATSERRSEVLSSMIEKILFDYEEAMTFEEIIDCCVLSFEIKPIASELKENLEALQLDKRVIIEKGNYTISDYVRLKLTKQAVTMNEKEDSRFTAFTKYPELEDVKEEDREVLWDKFNDYIYSCFLHQGKDAIYSFVSSNEEDFFDNHGEILRNLSKGINTSLYSVLMEIINNYPNRMDSEEITYLENLAYKAESFFALGLDENLHSEIMNTQLNDFQVFMDTNVLFTVLGIHSNPQDKAVMELVEVASNIGVNFRYLPTTIQELNKVKNYNKDAIQVTEFKPNHIRALLESNELTWMVKDFYERKLKDNRAKSPIYIIENDSRKIFASRDIKVYNKKFKFEENEETVRKLEQEYFDYLSMINKIRHARGLLPKNKHKQQIYHDVVLRESIQRLRNGQKNETDLRFLGITIDNYLIKFDKYLSRKENLSELELIRPTFISPVNFLRRIRGFIPLDVTDYRKAFISSVTQLTIPTGNKEASIAAQRAMTHIHNAGIDDMDFISRMTKNEILYGELKSIENGQDASRFVESEMQKYYQEELVNREKEIEEEKKHSTLAEDEILNLRKEVQQLKQQSQDDELAKKEAIIQEKEQEKLHLASTITELKKSYSDIEKNNREIVEKLKLREQEDHKRNKEEYVENEWGKKKGEYRKKIIIYLVLLVVVFALAVVTLLVPEYKKSINGYFNNDFAHLAILIGGIFVSIVVGLLKYIFEIDTKSFYYVFFKKQRLLIEKELKKEFADRFEIESKGNN